MGLVRQIVRTQLRMWGKDELCEAAELGVTELLTNVLVHASGDCELLVGEISDGVVVGVTDFDDGLPVAKVPTDDEPGGRGLFLLSQLAEEFEIHALTRGKQVWFRLALAPGADEKQPGTPADPRREITC
ncbi:ATP-binding protein [Kitasatospora sp. MAA4]|uniref:ATP-binding protein n=1 Tax=Kitasatospora sp. MAA4 TaxID=3035093 RepID=UPI00247544CA|nr:ATP-binding protein [Kitasatospora sp. MAA4]